MFDKQRAAIAALVLAAVLLPASADAAANVIVLNANAPGVGFNDPTPAAPVGGNTGTTVGAQRQIAFQRAAQIWGATLTSTQPIRVIAVFEDLACTATTAVLGAAGPYWSFRGFAPLSGFPGLVPNTWYPAALAEKRTGRDLTQEFTPAENYEVFAVFNSRIGQAGCVPNNGWYYGLDANTPSPQVDLVDVLLHELGHGLGFTLDTTDEETGTRLQGFPSVWEAFMLDLETSKRWVDMTAAERVASAKNTNQVVWTGTQTLTDLPAAVGYRPEIAIDGPGRLRGSYEAQPAPFGPPLSFRPVREILAPAYDAGAPSTTDGCEPFVDGIVRGVRGRIALLDDGNCLASVKVKNAQLAGAVGAVVVSTAAEGVPRMSGVDPTIAIPSLGIERSLGTRLRQTVQLSAAGAGGVPVSLQLNPSIRAGTSGGYPRLYTPDPLQPGSSVSHWDVATFPNQLMEPFITIRRNHQVAPPADLTLSLLRDIGW